MSTTHETRPDDFANRSARELRQLWHDVKDQVVQIASDDLMGTLALAVDIIDKEVPPQYLKSTLNINVTAAHYKSISLLTIEGAQLGFAVAHFSLAHPAKKRLQNDGRLALLFPAGAWQHVVTEDDVRAVFSDLRIDSIEESGDATKPVKVHFSTPQFAQQAVAVAEGKKLQDTPFKVVIPVAKDTRGGRGVGGKQRGGKQRSRRYDQHDRR